MPQNTTHTTWERLNKTVLTLATNTGRLQDTLGNAYFCHLSPLKKEEFPQNLQADFDKLGQELTKMGTIKATTQTMSDEEAMELSEMIVSMYDEVARKHCS